MREDSGELEIRPMKRDEVDFALDLAAKEGWNPGLYDADAFYRADPQGFLIGLLDGFPIGCISAISYEAVFGFIGFYIMVPEYRGRGYGLQLWRRALLKLEGHNIGLDSVPNQQDNYVRSGFKTAYRTTRYEGAASHPSGLHPLVEIRSVPFDDLCAYDEQFFPTHRDRFLRAWIGQPESRGVALVKRGHVHGYGLIRKCRRGHKIGPLFADGPEAAEWIFSHLTSRLDEGTPFFMDSPEVSAPAAELVKRHGMKAVFETARMYTGEAPAVDFDRLYGITSLELG